MGIRLQGSTRTFSNSQSCFILSTNSSACDTGLPASLWTFLNKLLWAAQHPCSRKIDLLLVTEHCQLTLEWTWAFVHDCPMARSTLPPLFLQSRFRSSQTTCTRPSAARNPSPPAALFLSFAWHHLQDNQHLALLGGCVWAGHNLFEGKNLTSFCDLPPLFNTQYGSAANEKLEKSLVGYFQLTKHLLFPLFYEPYLLY